VIHPKAELHETVSVGPHAVIGEHVRIGAHTVLGPNVVIEGWTVLGEGNRIFPGAVIGLEPQDLKYDGAPTEVRIGNYNRIREYVTIHRATREGEATLIGNDNLLMAYVHIAHNCSIGDQVIITNSVMLAGHVHIESRARLGGGVGIHQFTHIGELAMVGGMSRIDRDVPPFMMVEGHPARIRGLNLVGLKRAEASAESLSLLKKAYRLIYRSGIPMTKALQTLRTWPESNLLTHLIQFLDDSLAHPHRRGPLPTHRTREDQDLS
jgi:UDP-N-acetylglucosamine acyltransferase